MSSGEIYRGLSRRLLNNSLLYAALFVLALASVAFGQPQVFNDVIVEYTGPGLPDLDSPFFSNLATGSVAVYGYNRVAGAGQIWVRWGDEKSFTLMVDDNQTKSELGGEKVVFSCGANCTSPPPIWEIGLSVDGKTLYFSTLQKAQTPGSIWSLDRETGKYKRLVSYSSGQVFSYPAKGGDGKTYMFIGMPMYGGSIFRMDGTGEFSEQVCLTRVPLIMPGLAISGNTAVLMDQNNLVDCNISTGVATKAQGSDNMYFTYLDQQTAIGYAMAKDWSGYYRFLPGGRRETLVVSSEVPLPQPARVFNAGWDIEELAMMEVLTYDSSYDNQNQAFLGMVLIFPNNGNPEVRTVLRAGESFPVGRMYGSMFALRNSCACVFGGHIVRIPCVGSNTGSGFLEIFNGHNLAFDGMETVVVKVVMNGDKTTTVEKTIKPSSVSSERVEFTKNDPEGLYQVRVAGVPSNTVDLTMGVPVINFGGVVNGASFAPGQAVAPGAIVSVFGSKLFFCPDADNAQSPAIPLSNTLCGTEVWMGDRQLPLFYTSGGQINTQIPWEATPGTIVSLKVKRNGVVSSEEPVNITDSSPGVFRYSAFGYQQVAVITHLDWSLVTPSNPLRPGEAFTLWVTGLGYPAGTPPALGDAPKEALSAYNQVTVTLGGKPVVVSYAGFAPNFVGLYQVNGVAPPDVPTDKLVLSGALQGGSVIDTFQTFVAAH